jgi:hypothetical protein
MISIMQLERGLRRLERRDVMGDACAMLQTVAARDPDHYRA